MGHIRTFISDPQKKPEVSGRWTEAVKWPLKAFPIDQPREKRKKEKKPAHQMMPTYVDGDRTLKNHFKKKKVTTDSLSFKR